MRKNIIQSKTEPNKNDIWLSEEGLKKYGKNGWEPLGGNSNNSGDSKPVIIEIDSQDFINNGYDCNDNELQAILNYNVAFKMTNIAIPNLGTFILRPYSYVESVDGLIIGMFIEMKDTDSTRTSFLLNGNKLTNLF